MRADLEHQLYRGGFCLKQDGRMSTSHRVQDQVKFRLKKRSTSTAILNKKDFFG